ncbi:MAG: DNA/RNA non-specific endonuclease [Acidobacteria bacterium]|nr:DNA/RNA non-specific endonuclease [Acidobacteriota bacterium]
MLLTSLLLAIQSLSAQPNRFGLPACTAPHQQLATRTAFTLCLSNTHRVPIWTAYQLTPEMLDAPSAPRQHFRRDHELPASATDADYRRSGFHRSHLVFWLSVKMRVALAEGGIPPFGRGFSRHEGLPIRCGLSGERRSEAAALRSSSR